VFNPPTWAREVFNPAPHPIAAPAALYVATGPAGHSKAAEEE